MCFSLCTTGHNATEKNSEYISGVISQKGYLVFVQHRVSSVFSLCKDGTDLVMFYFL